MKVFKFYVIKQINQLQEVGKNARLRLAFLPTLLSCSRHLLRALFLNGARLKLVYLLSNQYLQWVTRLAEILYIT